MADTRRLEQQLERLQRHLALANKTAGLEVWTFVFDGPSVAGCRLMPSDAALDEHPTSEWLRFADAMERSGVRRAHCEAMVAEIQTRVDAKAPDFAVEYPLTVPDGPVQWKLARGAISYRANGAPTTLECAAIDITARKLSEEEARRHEERLELAILGSKTSTWDFELRDGRLSESSATFTNVFELLGYEADHTVDFPTALGTLIPAENRAELGADMQAHLDGTSLEWERVFPARFVDGSTRWLLARGVIQRDPSGRARRLTGISIDITQRMRTEEALRESEHRFRAVFDNAGVGFSIATTAGVLVDCNDVLCKLAGYTREELIGQHLPTVFIPDEVAAANERLRMLATDQVARYAYDRAVRRGDGTTVWINFTFNVMSRDVAGAPNRLLGVYQDITERKKLEDDARRTKERLELGIRNSGTTIFDLDIPQAELAASAQTPRHGPRATLTLVGWENFGYPADTDITEPERIGGLLHHPDDHQHADEVTQGYLSGALPKLETEYRIRHADGSFSWRLVRGQALRDAQGRPTRLIGSMVDITERKSVENELRESELRSRATFENAAVGFAIASTSGIFEDCNATMCALFGYSREQLIGQHGPSLLFPYDVELTRERLRALVAGEISFYTLDKHHELADGSRAWVNVSFSIMSRDASGQPDRILGVFQDITERLKLEDDLRRTKERLELGIRGSGTAVFDLGLANAELAPLGAQNHAPQATLTLIGWESFGYDPTTSITDPDQIGALLQHPDDRQQAREVTEAYLRGESPKLESEYRTVHRDGSVSWRLCRGEALRDGDGRPTRLIGSLVDITEIKRIETELRESEQLFRATFENSAVGFAITDVNAVYVDCNETLCRLFGLERDEIVGTSGPTTLFSEMAPAAWHETMRQLRDGEIAKHTAYRRFSRKDGTHAWTNVTLSVMSRDAAGKAERVLGIYLDITERMELEEDLRRTRERMELGIRGSGTTIFEIELPHARLEKATLSLINGWEQFGYDPPPPLLEAEQVRALIVHPDDQAKSHATTARYLRGETPKFESEYRVIHKDGAISWWLTRGEAIRDPDGKPKRLLGSMVNITQIKRIEEELLTARQAAELANRAKDEFLANVSHEIRTPMNAILGMTELALDAAENAHQRQLLSTVKVAARNLLHVINDLLDFSKITAGKLALDHADFSLRAAIGDTLRALAVRAHRKSLELVCNVNPEVPDLYFGDAGRVRQVLTNLVGNAIKFTPRGEVVVEVMLDRDAPADEDSIPLRFNVRDTGIGIAPDKHASIFRAFEQEDASTTRKFGGTGLGLTISSQLATLMGGRITVESEPGRGSTFTFTARIDRSSKPEWPGLSSRGPLEGLEVLVVDDNETNREILLEWLVGWRMRPTAAADATSAFEALERAQESATPYPLVLLDGRMPDGDGITLAGRIRDRFGPSAHRLILLSSDHSPALEARSREIGIHAYLLKPVQQSELLETIWGVMSGSAQLERDARTVEVAEPERVARGLHVLIAEDNELNVNLLRELLGQRDHRVEVAGDGRAALELAGKSDAPYDLMLLDLHMPEMDGFEVVHAIRERERGTAKHLPIIALTARSSSRDRDKALAAGMDDFLSKPLDVKALWDAIDRITSDVPSRQRSRLLDARVIVQTCGGRPAVLERLCELFRQTAPVQMAATRAALDERDFARLRPASHILAGTLSAFSTIAGALASTLEDAAIDEDLERCVSLVAQLEATCSMLMEETRGLTLERLDL